MNTKELKQYLLSTNYFIDNDYLNQYLNLLRSAHSNLICYKETHHSLPVCYYRYEKGASSRGQAKALASLDSSNVLVTLPFWQHCQAHWLLYRCTTGRMQLANWKAFKAMTRVLGSPLSIEKPLTEELLRSLQERKELIKSEAPISFKSKRSKCSRKKQIQKEKDKQKKLQQQKLREQEAEKTYQEFLQWRSQIKIKYKNK